MVHLYCSSQVPYVLLYEKVATAGGCSAISVAAIPAVVAEELQMSDRFPCSTAVLLQPDVLSGPRPCSYLLAGINVSYFCIPSCTVPHQTKARCTHIRFSQIGLSLTALIVSGGRRLALVVVVAASVPF